MSNQITAFVPQTSPTLPVRVAMLATVAPPELPLLALGPLTARLQLGAGSGAGLAGELRGTATLAGARMELRGVVGGGDPMLRGTLDGLRFSRLAAELLDGVELPPELPDFEVSGVEMELHPSTGAFRVRGTATLRAWPALGVREGCVTASVDVERTAATGATPGRTRAAVSLAAEGPFTLAEGLACRRFAVRFALAQGESCAASGELEATVLEHPVTLSAEYAGTAAARHLRLSAAGELTLSAVPGAELSLRGFALEAARETGEGGAAPSTTWSVGGSGTLTLRSLFRPDDTWRLGGDLTLRAGASGAALALVFGPGSALPVTLPLGPGRTLRLTLAPERLELRRDAAGWAFEAASSLAVEGLPEPFAAVLADRVSSTLRVDGTGVSFTVDRLLNTLLLPLPDLSLPDGTTAPLGSLALAATDFSVRLGEGVAVGARLGVGLPPEINHLFGVDRGADGRPAPRTRLLETYDDAARPATPLGVEVRAGLRQGTLGVEVLPGALPFRGFREENDEFVLEMGELGSVRFRRPVLRYDPAAGTLHAEGGFTQRGLKLPLGWLRPVLGSLGMEALAERLPAAVPLAEVSLLRDGEVDAELAIEVFEGLLRAPLDPALRQAVRAVAGHFNRLPPRLRDYLDVRLPGELAFRLSVTPDGGFQLHLSTGTETERPGPGATRSLTPLKLLVPTVGPLGVELVGIRLYGVTVGMALGGQLLVLQVDAEADRFDLVSLAAAMALDAAGSAVLRPPAQLGQTLVVRDLLAVVVIATQVPVPIPLFYDEVAVLAGEPTGFELAVRVRFPRPRLSLRELLGSAQRIRRFATEEEYFFGGDPGARGPREMDLRWTIGESYLQLPPWLGGEVLGVRGRDLAEVSALETIERALDAVKGFEVVPLIESIPLQHRVGETALALGPLRAQARWLLASLAEYPAAVAGEPAWASRGATIQRVLELARAAPGAGGAAADERGLVALLGGACAVGGATLEATAALVAGRRRGVATGFRVAGELERLFALELAGVVVAAPREGRWEMEGTSSLALFGERVFAGSVRGDAGSLRIDGVLDLFAWAPGSPLQARGELRGHLDRDGFLLEGAAWVSLGGGDALTLGGARFHLSPGRAELAGTLLGQTVSLALSAEGRRVRLEGGLEHALEVPGLLRVGAWEGAGGPRVRVAGPEAPELLLDGSLTVLGVTSSTRVHLSADGFRCDFAGDLLGLFACRGSLRGGGLLSGQGVEASLVLENGLAALEEMVLARVREGLSSLRARAGEAGATLAAERDRYNEALGREIRRLEQEAAERRGGALQAVDAASQQVREARWAVDDLDRRIAEARAAVAADRERVEASFRDAQAHLEEKRRGLDVIREQIAAHDAWYHGLHWALQALSWGPYLAGKAALELAWAGADAALSLARDVVTTAGLAKDAVHPDADPRVTTLLAARLTVDAALQTASAVLKVAEQGLHALPDWVLQPTLLAAEASRVVGDAALALAQGTVEAADQALRGAEQAVAWMGEHAMPVRVERLAFTTALEPGRLPRVQASARLSWALPGGGRDVRDAELDIDFADLPGTAARLATQLLPAA